MDDAKNPNQGSGFANGSRIGMREKKSKPKRVPIPRADALLASNRGTRLALGGKALNRTGPRARG